MNIIEIQIHDMLESVMIKSFPNNKIQVFDVEVCPKELKSKHGDYNLKEKKLRIFNLSQRTDYLISTALHCSH